MVYPSDAAATFFQGKERKSFWNPAMLVFIGKLLLSTNKWVPMWQGFSHFSPFFYYFVLARLTERLKDCEEYLSYDIALKSNERRLRGY